MKLLISTSNETALFIKKLNIPKTVENKPFKLIEVV